MKKTLSLLAALAITVSLTALAIAAPRPKAWTPSPSPVAAKATAVESDPDLPFGTDPATVDKEAYIKAREAWNDDRNGNIPFDQAFNARLSAIRTLHKQTGSLAPFAVFGTWTNIGPFPIPNGQTTTVSTAISGRVTCLVVNPTNPDVAYMGTAQGGVWRTMNGGLNWTPIFDGAASLAIGALALAPTDPTILYVGTGEANGSCDSYFGVGLYRIDNADTSPVLNGPFNPTPTTDVLGVKCFTGRTISQILVDPSDAATIFVSTASGIGGLGCDSFFGTVPPLAIRGMYRSSDATSGSPSFAKIKVVAAASIVPDASGNRSINDMAYDPADATGNTLVCWVLGVNAAGDGGVWRTTNAKAASPAFTQTLISTLASGARGTFAVARVAGVTTVVLGSGESASGTSCTTNSGCLRKSIDGGLTWSAKLAGGGGYCGGQCFYDLPVAMSPVDPTLILIGGSGNGTCSRVYARSINGGSTFTAAGGADVGLHADAHFIVFAPSNPSVVYFGSDGGVWRSDDGGATWASRNTIGLSAAQYQSIAMHPTDPKFTIGGTQDNGTQMYKPDGTWNRIDFGDGGFTVIDQNAPDNTNVTMYHTYFNQTNAMGYAKVTNVGSASDGAWSFYGCGFGGSIPNGMVCAGVSAIQFYAPMAGGPGNPNTLYFGSDRLYRSADAGLTMLTASQIPIVASRSITAIAVSAQNDNVRLVGLNSGANNLWGTTTGSAILTNFSAGLPAKYVGRIAIDPTNANVAYVAFCGFGLAAGQHIWKTSNLLTGTPTFAPSGTGIPDVPVNAICVDPLFPQNVYAGTDVGVYASTDGGATWTPFVTGMPVVAVFDMGIQATSHTLRVATHGRGIWERALDQPVATQLALVGAEIVDGAAKMTWYSADGARQAATLYRRAVPGDYVAVASLLADGQGQFTYTDKDVVPGRSYEYIVGLMNNGVETRLGHVWLDVPVTAEFALRSLSGNPVRGPLQFAVSLPTAAPASLELVDITGRRVAKQDLGTLGAGNHSIQMDASSLRPGVYWARLTQAQKLTSTRIAIVR